METTMNMLLMMVPIGETRVVVRFRGKDRIKSRLQNLGFIEGESVQVLGENPSGVILLVKGVRIAIDRGLASMIIVK